MASRAYCSLWNASEVAELDLSKDLVTKHIPLRAPSSATAAGSHPTALLLSPDEKRLYVALSNADAVAVVDTATGSVVTTAFHTLARAKVRGQLSHRAGAKRGWSNALCCGFGLRRRGAV